MSEKAITLIFLFAISLQAQEFIPHGELLQPGHVKYISSKKIEAEKAGFYSTAKDGIPSGKAKLKTLVNYSPKGFPVAVNVTDSTGTTVDSFYYSGSGSVERIVRFRPHSDTLSTLVERLYFSRDSAGRTGEAQVYDITSASVKSAYRYFYNKAGKLALINRIFSADTSATDSLSWQFDKNERLIIRSEGDQRVEYKYDQAGNITEMKEFAGKIPGSTTKYTYDASRRLVKATTSGKGFNSTTEYLYTKDGILILIKTKSDRGIKGSETWHTEIREVTFHK